MFFRLSVAFLIVALVVPVAAALSDRSWVYSMGLEALGGTISHEGTGIESNEVSRDLDDQSCEVRQRIEVKCAIIQSLIAGRTTLAEVASQFIAMDADRPAYMEVLRMAHPGETDEEKMVYNILNYTRPYLAKEPLAYRILVMSRLLIEFHQMTSVPTPNSVH